MINDKVRDFRFLKDVNSIKQFLEECFEMYTPDDLKKILLAAERLEIPDYCHRNANDVLYDIGRRLTIFEQERVDPRFIIDRIEQFLVGN